MHRRRLVVVSAAVLIAAVAACGGGGGGDKKKAAATTTTPKPVVAPLTGVPDPGALSLNRPALSVKIENTPESRPQTGLDVADVVYEEVTEGDITRFLAVYNSSSPDVVGAVRSVRAVDADLVAPLVGVFAYSGGAAPTVDLIRRVPTLNTVDETQAGDAMFRDRAKRAPHNLYGRGQGLVDKGGQPVPVKPLFGYLEGGAAFNGDPVSQFTVGFKAGFAVTYAFNAASRTWNRAYGATPHTVQSGAQISPTNVVVEFVGCCAEGAETGNAQTVGQGDAWIFSDGKLVRGKWARSDRAQQTQYTDAGGAPVKLNPGRTWVELLPVGPDYPVEVTPGAPAAPTGAAPGGR
jgi:hypothetical protein